MNVSIFYFTGSGNSLVVARDIAKGLDGRLISISSIIKKETISPDTEAFGIVFPVYYADFGGLPLIIERFVKKLDKLDSKYIFAVCTHAGGPCDVIRNIKELIELNGGHLALGFTIKMSKPYSVGLKMKSVIMGYAINSKEEIIKDFEKQQQIYDRWSEKLEIIKHHLINRDEGIYETMTTIKRSLKFPFLGLSKSMFNIRYRNLAKISSVKANDKSNYSFQELISLADNSFEINENCNGCGICARVCPVNNIIMKNDKPEWQHHCETCYSCYVWCPQDAIHGEIVRYNKKYHHPEVKLSDMIKQKNKIKEVI